MRKFLPGTPGCIHGTNGYNAFVEQAIGVSEL
jgi:hypothetical protein